MNMKTFRNMLLVLLASVILGTVLLILVYSLPVNVMRNNVSKSIDALLQKGDYPSWSEGGGITSILDYFTDAIMINTAIYSSGKHVYDSMMNQRRKYNEARSRTEDLSMALKAENTNEDGLNVVSYPRYWHGYLLYLKPMLMFLSVNRLKMINFLLQFFLLIAVVMKMSYKVGKAYVFAFAMAVLVINPISTVLCLTFCDVYYIVLIMMIIMLDYNNSLNRDNRYYIFFTFGGIATAYFDLLTYPFASLGIPTVLYVLMNANERIKLSESLSSIVKIAMSWGFGYAGMWSSKWLVSSLLTGNNIIWDALNAASFRINGAWNGVPMTWAERFKGLSVRLASMQGFYAALILISVILVIILIAVFVYISIIRGSTSFQEIITLFIVSLYPFIWYSILQNHTIIHFHLFTHKLLSVSVFAALCILIKCSGYKHHG